MGFTSFVQANYFNPRTHVGCDPLFEDTTQKSFYFNPRTHVGCDNSLHAFFCSARYFNPRTHVGCDKHFMIGRLRWQNFNPRTHVGCDGGGGAITAECMLFQSTHPCGVRRIDFEENFAQSCISIHAPMWGATSVFGAFRTCNYYFNPRTHVGCDLVLS